MAITLRGADHLYAIVDTCSGAIKVGRSGDPEARLAQLQTGCPSELYAWWVVKHGGFIEPVFHGLLGEERIRGEWYPDEGVAHKVLQVWRAGATNDAASLLEEFGRALRVVGIERSLIRDAWDSDRMWINCDAGTLKVFHDEARADRDEQQRRMDLLDSVHLREFHAPITAPAVIALLPASEVMVEVAVNG